MAGKHQTPIETIIEILRTIERVKKDKSISIKDVCRAYQVPSTTLESWQDRGIEWFIDKKTALDALSAQAKTTNHSAAPYVPPPAAMPEGHNVLVIPDMHHPFAHPDALPFLKAVRDEYECNLALCLGDEIDAHALSKYPTDPDGLTAGKEIEEAIKHLESFYREFPHMLVCESNHTVRPWKRAFEEGLPASFLPTYSKFLNAPDGWVWKKKHEVDGVIYIHGDSGKSGFTAHINYMKAFKRSVVIGHIHSYAGVNYEGAHFAMNAGCLIDVEAYCFKYARGMPINVNLGCGVVIGGKHAFFVPMHLTEEGRWTGTI